MIFALIDKSCSKTFSSVWFDGKSQFVFGGFGGFWDRVPNLVLATGMPDRGTRLQMTHN
jgi:hypothetical protein